MGGGYCSGSRFSIPLQDVNEPHLSAPEILLQRLADNILSVYPLRFFRRRLKSLNIKVSISHDRVNRHTAAHVFEQFFQTLFAVLKRLLRQFAISDIPDSNDDKRLSPIHRGALLPAISSHRQDLSRCPALYSAFSISGFLEGRGPEPGRHGRNRPDGERLPPLPDQFVGPISEHVLNGVGDIPAYALAVKQGDRVRCRSARPS